MVNQSDSSPPDGPELFDETELEIQQSLELVIQSSRILELTGATPDNQSSDEPESGAAMGEKLAQEMETGSALASRYPQTPCDAARSKHSSLSRKSDNDSTSTSGESKPDKRPGAVGITPGGSRFHCIPGDRSQSSFANDNTEEGEEDHFVAVAINVDDEEAQIEQRVRERIAEETVIAEVIGEVDRIHSVTRKFLNGKKLKFSDLNRKRKRWTLFFASVSISVVAVIGLIVAIKVKSPDKNNTSTAITEPAQASSGALEEQQKGIRCQSYTTEDSCEPDGEGRHVCEWLPDESGCFPAVPCSHFEAQEDCIQLNPYCLWHDDSGTCTHPAH